MHGQFTNADARAQASPLAIALGYIKRGWNVLPLPYRKKAPKDEGWQRRTITQENAHQFLAMRRRTLVCSSDRSRAG